MRRIAIALAALMVAPALAAAQAPRRGAGAADAPTLAEVLVANRAFLRLEDDQVARLRDLATTQRRARDELQARLEAVRGDSARRNLTEEQRAELRTTTRATREGLMETARGIRSILTVEQMDRVGVLGAMLSGAARRGPAAGGLRDGRGAPGQRPGIGPGAAGRRLQRQAPGTRQYMPAPTPRDRAAGRRNTEGMEIR